MMDLEITKIPISEIELSDIDQRANRIISLIKKSAEIWLEVATEVNDAKQKLSSIGFKQFLDQASLTTAIADKMPRIAQQMILYSENAKRHISKLEGWTTLYEVAKLPTNKISELIKTLDEQPETVVTRAFIQSFKISKSSKNTQTIQIAEILISEELLMRLDLEQFHKFRDNLDEIKRIIDSSILAASINIKSKTLTHLEMNLFNTSLVGTEEMIIEHREQSPTTIENMSN